MPDSMNFTDDLEIDGGSVSTGAPPLSHISITNGITKVNVSELAGITGINKNGCQTKSLDSSKQMYADTNERTCSLPTNVSDKTRHSSDVPMCTYGERQENAVCEILTSHRSAQAEASATGYATDINSEQNIIHDDRKKHETDMNHCEEPPELTPTQRAVSCTEQQTDGRNLNEESISESQLPVPAVDEATVMKFEPLMKIIDKIADGQRVPPQITMQYEMLRFCTLRSYPKVNKPFITRIAQAGFYYANSGDELVCYCCARRKSNWSETDIPLEVHRQMNPNCRFLVENAEVNVPIKPIFCNESRSGDTNTTSSVIVKSSINVNHTSSNKSRIEQSAQVGECRTLVVKTNVASNVSDSHHTSTQHKRETNVVESGITSGSNSYAQEASWETATGTSPNELLNSAADRGSTQQTIRPKYPKYANTTSRLASFSDCRNINKPPEILAESGLFYAGFGDCVRCFQCGVGLRHWSQDDDPWIEHSRWSTDCSFVKRMRGQEFVNLVQMAVQYSQTHGASANPSSAVENTGATLDEDDTEDLIHTDAAQSVLEMGYHPNIIRRAIRKVLESNNRCQLTGVKLMEIILEIEDADNPDQEPPVFKSHNDTESAKPSASIAIKSTETSRSVECGSEKERNKLAPTMHKDRRLFVERKKLKEENEKLKQQSICSKCKKNEVCIVFLPCGHLITCEECAPSVKYCSVQGCGKYIKGTVRTYMA